MFDETDFSGTDFDVLAARCAQETGRYLRHTSHDPRYCYEIFRRALQDGCPAAWEALVQIYTPLVAGWVKNHPRWGETHESVDFFVNGAFARLAHHLTPEKFQRARDLSSVLRYLKLCTYSEIEDHVERLGVSDQDQDQELSVPGDQLIEMESGIDATVFWQWVEARLHSEAERRVIEGLFRLGLKPKEIYDSSPGEFRDVREIYRISENFLERLRRDPQVKRWSAG